MIRYKYVYFNIIKLIRMSHTSKSISHVNHFGSELGVGGGRGG